MDGLGQVDGRAIAHGLARIDAFHDRQFVAIAPHQLGEPDQDFLARGRVQAAPASVIEGFARLLHRVVDVFRVTRGDIGQGLAGGRVDRSKSLLRARGLELAVDESIARQVQVLRDRAVLGMGQ